VAIVDIVVDKAEDLAAQLRVEGFQVSVWQADISDFASFQKAVEGVFDSEGRIDILVNNAGIVAAPTGFLDSKFEDWEKIIDVDFKGSLFGVKLCAPYMIQQGGGAIINIGSDSARFGEPGIVVYSGAKGAINSASKGLAKELAPHNIRVNVVSPGLIHTAIIDLARSTPEGRAMVDATTKMIPMGAMGQPIDVGNIVAFLAGDGAAYITGQTFSVNGGMLMIG
jgi:NAD(P)-dependent dehydrogenase (short-subunit alcohol dehydrogenase family)